MSPEEIKNKIDELERLVKKLVSDLEEEKEKVKNTAYVLDHHNHTGDDGTKILEHQLNLKPEQPIKMGYGGMLSGTNASQSIALGSTSEQIQMSFVSGKDMGGAFGTTTGNLQFNLLHQPLNASNQSFITAFRPPIFAPIPGSTISVTAAGNTVTINGYNFVTNSLAGAQINIFSSAGALIETQTIASNTATVITISGTWGATTSGGTFVIFQPVFFGSADTPYQRFYTMEGTGGGIRFGVGVTAGSQNQNGLLYMDATGDLYWRNKSGTSTKLN